MINSYIDHTILKPEATTNEIDKLCSEAAQYQFASVCVNPSWVKYCKGKLLNTEVKVCTVIGFPLGANTTEVKAFETKNAIDNGADEIDMVINIGKLKEKQYDYVVEDIKAVVDNANGKTVKVIIETCLLSDEEKTKACELIMEAKADFVKTSTGFNTGGATQGDIKLFKEVVKDTIKIKASGGIRSIEDANLMISLGANRLGTSGGVQIVTNQKNNEGY